MASDDKNKQKQQERQRILEEIRRRAEEAEMQRLEEEDRKTEVNSPPKESTAAPQKLSTAEKKIEDLRERIVIALDRGKPEKALAILDEFRELAPVDPEIIEYEERLEELQREQARAKRAQRTADTREEEEAKRKEEEKQRRKIAGLIADADSLYQQEKYEKSLAALDQILELDPENEDAIQFRETIEKAFALAEQVRKEEETRREKFKETPAPYAPEPVIPRSDAEIWGSTTVQKKPSEFDVPEDEPQSIVAQKPPVFDRAVVAVSRIRFPIKKILTIVGIVAGAFLGYIIVDSIRNAVFPPTHALVVLPPAFSTDDPTEAYIVEGFAEDLIADLSRVERLRVFAATTTFHLRRNATTPVQTARSLGANYFLQWNLSAIPDAVMLNISLYDTLASQPIYVNRYTISRREFPSLRREIVKAIIDTMHVELSPEVETEFARRSTAQWEAYDAYLQGRYYLANRDKYFVSDAADMFERSLTLDSTFSQAYAELGWSDILSFEMGVDTSQTRLARASSAASRAVSNGFFGSEPYRVLGMADYLRKNYEKSIQRLQRAAVLGPSDAETHRRLAIAYVTTGRLDEAERAADVAVACDPRSVDSYTVQGQVFEFARNYKAAVMSFERGWSLSADPSEYGSRFFADALVFAHNHDRAAQILADRVARDRQSAIDYYKLARVYQSGGRSIQLWEGALKKAKELNDQHLAVYPNDPLVLMQQALVDSRLGHFKDAQNSANKAYRLAPDNYEVIYNLAKMFALQQDREKAMSYLAHAIDRRYDLEFLLDMDLYNLHDDGEFKQLLVRY